MAMGNEPRPLFVISDAHLGAGAPDAEAIKSQRLAAFWRQVATTGGDLVILGDLFDFWFEYRNAIPRFHFDHLVALRDLVQGGARVYYVAGNHDFWAGPFLRDELGVVYCEDELLLEHTGRKLRFAHGDGWPPGERGYRFMKRVFRNRAAIGLFRLLSPDIGFPLARWFSNRSRGTHHLPPRTLEIYARMARNRLASDCDVLFIGHLHECRHVVWPEGEWIITGDWMEHFSYAVVDASGLRLCRWQDNGPPVVVAAEVLKSSSSAPIANR
jgi:UDP-2,3-diacylglucosamine hydrolase